MYGNTLVLYLLFLHIVIYSCSLIVSKTTKVTTRNYRVKATLGWYVKLHSESNIYWHSKLPKKRYQANTQKYLLKTKY